MLAPLHDVLALGLSFLNFNTKKDYSIAADLNEKNGCEGDGSISVAFVKEIKELINQLLELCKRVVLYLLFFCSKTNAALRSFIRKQSS